jgi:hypothetical protein
LCLVGDGVRDVVNDGERVGRCDYNSRGKWDKDTFIILTLGEVKVSPKEKQPMCLGKDSNLWREAANVSWQGFEPPAFRRSTT